MNRNLHVLGLACVFLAAQVEVSRAGELWAFKGRWQHRASMASPCNTCKITIVQHGSALILLTNMGWSTVIDADRTAFATVAEGRIVRRDGKVMNVSCAAIKGRLYVIVAPEDPALPQIKSIFIRE